MISCHTRYACISTDSKHLLFAGAMAEAATGERIADLVDKYVLKKLGMNSTTFGDLNNPQLSGGITSSAEDYEKLLISLTNYELLPKEIIDAMDTDTYPLATFQARIPLSVGGCLTQFAEWFAVSCILISRIHISLQRCLHAGVLGDDGPLWSRELV